MGLPVKQKLNIGEKTSLSPAMQATLCLVALYYGVILIQFIIGIKGELAMITKNEEKTDGAKPVTNDGEKKEDDAMQKQMDNINKILDDTKETTALIPMIAILIVFARLRAKVDLEGTNPPDYARKAFFGIVGVMYTQAFFGLIFNILQNVMGDSTMLTKFKSAMKLLLTFGLYTCIVVIFHSIFTLTKTASE